MARLGLNVVGLSAFHHDSAACILRGAELVGAVEEERFTRRKHQGGLPVHAFRWCLDAADISIQEIDAVAIGIDPVALADRRATFDTQAAVERLFDVNHLRVELGIEAPIHFVPHHRSHAASAFHYSGFEDAAVLIADGVGDWPCTTVWHGSGRSLTEVASWDFPNSLGLFYATITSWLGFRVNHDEYKVMGLAAYGQPSLVAEIAQMVPADPDRAYTLAPSYFEFLSGKRMFSDALIDVLGPPRARDDALTDHHRNVAASAQAVLESRLLALAELAHTATGARRLCVAGGVGLNAVANARIVADGPFEDVFIQPAAGDAGTALGAASAIMIELGGPIPSPMTDARLGPRFSSADARAVVTGADLDYTDYSADEPGLVERVAQLIGDGAIVGWFHGPMEFGPRALGARSVIADPRAASTRNRINLFIKDREPWRPLAPMIRHDRVADYFDSDRSLRYMVETADVLRDAGLDAVTHCDGTARPQAVPPEMQRMCDLLAEVDARIGVPVLISTSFNHASEPIVHSPADALLAASRLGLDALVIEDLVITELQPTAFDRVADWQRGTTLASGEPNLYPL